MHLEITKKIVTNPYYRIDVHSNTLSSQNYLSSNFKKNELVVLPCGAKAKVHSIDQWGNISLFGFRKTYHSKNLKKA
jgi:hypothetical protein